MPEPITIALFSGLLSGLNASVTAVRFAYEIKNTPQDVKTCLDLVCSVDKDIQDAINLRAQHIKQLSMTPERLRRLDRIIKQAIESITDVGKLLEGCRKEAHGGKVPLQGRIKWILGDSMAFSRRTANLQQQHAAINVEITYMNQLELLKPLKDFASSTTIENVDLWPIGRKRSSSRLSIFSDSDVPPPEYSRLTPRPSMAFLTQPADQVQHLHIPSPEPPEKSPDDTTPRQSVAFEENPWSQPTSSDAQDWSDLEAVARPDTTRDTKEWEPERGHIAQNWHPIGAIPQSLIPGCWTDHTKASQPDSRNASELHSPPNAPLILENSPPDMSRNYHPPAMPTQFTAFRKPEIISAQSYEYTSSSQNPRFHGWELPAVSPPQIQNSPRNRSFSTISSQSSEHRGWEIPSPKISQHWDALAVSPRSSISQDLQPDRSSHNETQRDEVEEEEDPEVAFYRDMRLQEEQRQRRRGARRNDR